MEIIISFALGIVLGRFIIGKIEKRKKGQVVLVYKPGLPRKNGVKYKFSHWYQRYR